jgi:glycosyltransferase involved in cell wall biosynthesis
MSNKKVSIIVTARNYGKYLPQALDSALGQTYDNFETIVVNDGSTDNTEEVLDAYRGIARVVMLRLDGVGLAAAANRGIKESSGDYIVRLDADDWFDENLVAVLANYLDRMPDIGLVFGDYYTVDAGGEIIGNLRRAKVNDDVELLDRPCLAAGAMYRRECFDEIQGYNESLRYQEDYDFWIKFIDKFKIHNVSLPLMYYRQHAGGMSRNWDARMAARRQVKHQFVKNNRSELTRNVMAVIPARGDRINGEYLPLLKLGNETLLERCIRATKAADAMVKVIVSTEDQEIADHAVAAGAEVPFLRSQNLSGPEAMVENVVANLLERVQLDGGYADIAVVCHPHSPFIKTEHIAEAIDTLLLYKTDSVLAVVEDLTYHWMIGRHGLKPVGYRERVVRQDKDLIFKEAGSVYAVDTQQFLSTGNFFGERIGHIELSSHDAFRIHTQWDYEVAQQLISMPEPSDKRL